jgi:sucrose-6-phosphate hydrolase SacC (GH32 family)
MIPRLLLPLSLVLALAAPARADYLFTYFTKNGEDGLHLAWSPDGYKWERLNEGKSYLTPKVGKSKLMRDPCVVRAADGTFHLVWTSGWNENNIGYASTRDFLTWSEQKEIPVMAHEPTVRNSWAPEVAFDPQRQEYLIFWASTIPGRFTQTAGSSETDYNHRMYYTTTKDFVTFAPTQLFYDPGFSVIDATLLHARGRHYLIIKDETRHPPKKYLQITESADVRGPYRPLSAPFTPPGLWVEGPTAVPIGEDFLVYYDAYQTKHYGAMRSRDLRTWEDVTPRLQLPDEGTPVRPRHGTVIAVPRPILDRLRAPR